MSTRERWTVYPLLFLTLGIALTDKLTQQVRTRQVVCQSLLVTNRQGAPQVQVTSSDAGGIVRTQSASQGVNVFVGHTGNLAGLLFSDPQGKWIPTNRSILQVPPKQPPKAPAAKEPPPRNEPSTQERLQPPNEGDPSGTDGNPQVE